MKPKEERPGYPKVIDKNRVWIVEGKETNDENITYQGGGFFGLWGINGVSSIEHEVNKLNRRMRHSLPIQSTSLSGTIN